MSILNKVMILVLFLIIYIDMVVIESQSFGPTTQAVKLDLSVQANKTNASEGEFINVIYKLSNLDKYDAKSIDIFTKTPDFLYQPSFESINHSDPKDTVNLVYNDPLYNYRFHTNRQKKGEYKYFNYTAKVKNGLARENKSVSFSCAIRADLDYKGQNRPNVTIGSIRVRKAMPIDLEPNITKLEIVPKDICEYNYDLKKYVCFNSSEYNIQYEIENYNHDGNGADVLLYSNNDIINICGGTHSQAGSKFCFTNGNFKLNASGEPIFKLVAKPSENKQYIKKYTKSDIYIIKDTVYSYNSNEATKSVPIFIIILIILLYINWKLPLDGKLPTEKINIKFTNVFAILSILLLIIIIILMSLCISIPLESVYLYQYLLFTFAAISSIVILRLNEDESKENRKKNQNRCSQEYLFVCWAILFLIAFTIIYHSLPFVMTLKINYYSIESFLFPIIMIGSLILLESHLKIDQKIKSYVIGFYIIPWAIFYVLNIVTLNYQARFENLGMKYLEFKSSFYFPELSVILLLEFITLFVLTCIIWIVYNALTSLPPPKT